MKQILLLSCLFVFFGCKQVQKETLSHKTTGNMINMDYANGFTVQKSDTGITIINITSPWPGAETAFKYALVPKEKMAMITLNKDAYDAIVAVPVERIIVTSTTHISALDALGVEDKLVGFPNTDLISSEKTRKRIQEGYVRDLAINENLNTEYVIASRPDVLVGFGINNENKAYETIKRAGVPLVYNGEWIEETPLGKAEWIKFFAPFFGKEKMADSIFTKIKKEYRDAKKLALNAKNKPTVLTGGLYKDVWHVAGGKSWMAQFLKDAQADYLWSGNKRTGGIPLSVEAVIHKAQNADFWFNPSLHTSYSEMLEANRHYKQFHAFKNKTVFSNCISKGATGGLIYYELAPQRPDLVLKDLIHIFHPELLPKHKLFFFKPLK
ncbi:ABC transporter substrate-binding protein [Maribacter sp. 2304DJ31-5]|uniref:ABC transporter substrate-binding protein n=1 Tax=Maribacter sp. 2304DJ31-5 TaxID=3386273 RepID=UPI0039BC474C